MSLLRFHGIAAALGLAVPLCLRPEVALASHGASATPSAAVAAAAPAPGGTGAPRTAADAAAIRAWVEAHKGLGAPSYAEGRVAGKAVLVAWNIPTSGFNQTYFWIYCEQSPHEWRLVVADSFVPPRDQAHSAEIDGAKQEVRFLGAGREVYARQSIAGCKAPAGPGR